MATVQPPNPLPPDESLGGVLLVLTCVLTTFTIVTTGLRLWARYKRRALGWVRQSHLQLLELVLTSKGRLCHHGLLHPSNDTNESPDHICQAWEWSASMVPAGRRLRICQFPHMDDTNIPLHKYRLAQM
jgi:hypothetical protein